MKGRDYTGSRFHHLTVIGEAEKHMTIGHRRVLCVCDCGNEKTFNLPALVAGKVKSCGCHSAKKASERLHPHREPVRRLPTHREVETLVRYEPSTGKLFWRNRPEEFSTCKATNDLWNARLAGKEIAARDTKGYVTTTIFGQQIRAHRLIFFMVTGEWPGCVDHINGIKDDNRWINLRRATRHGNQRNQKKPRTNTSGFKGVIFDKAHGSWYFQMRKNDGSRFTKTGFKSREEAAEACRLKREELHGEFANHG